MAVRPPSSSVTLDGPPRRLALESAPRDDGDDLAAADRARQLDVVSEREQHGGHDGSGPQSAPRATGSYAGRRDAPRSSSNSGKRAGRAAVSTRIRPSFSLRTLSIE